ncbi:MAG TPA: hypothetical protein VN132_13710, partial [Bdellovibrio sp.]|nr:hypothetical protein [Bdellovibrio sp.]
QSAFAIFHPEMGDTGTKDMKAGEGLLLQAHKLVRGDLPAWNKIGGDRDASDLAKHGHEPILRFLSEVDRDCPYRAELPLRSLAKNAVVVNEELELHLIRMFALNFTGDLKEALEIHRGMQRSNPDSDKTLNRSNCKRWIERWCR